MSTHVNEIDSSVSSHELLQHYWDDRWRGSGQVLGWMAEQAHRAYYTLRESDVEDSTRRESDIYFTLFNTNQAIDELKGETEQISETISAYDDRIEVLKEQATLEGYSLNHASEMAFSTFLGKNPLLRLGFLFLMENGNLRAVWKGRNGAHVGLQFLHNGFIQYVIFKQREVSSPMSRVCGRDTVDGIRRQIAAFDLDNVLYTS